MKHKLIILSATASALLLWLGLIIKGRPIPTKEHLAYKDSLAKQLQYDLSINQAVLEARQSSKPDKLTKAIEQLESSRGQLEALPGYLTTQANPTLQPLRTSLKQGNQILEQKVLLVEQFKADHTRIKTSLSQLSALLKEIKNNSAAARSPLEQALIELVNQASPGFAQTLA